MSDYSFARNLEQRQRRRDGANTRSWVTIGLLATVVFLMAVRSWPLWSQFLVLALGLLVAFFDYRSSGVRTATRQPTEVSHIPMSARAIAAMVAWMVLTSVMFNFLGDPLALQHFLIQLVVALVFGVLSAVVFRFIYRERTAAMRK
ncbi:hypothetical protein [Corynebacterium pelargi]|uniref:Uncharacterized protein n=1 Tax=Corynebacterium pelargi TaxID=1471400 RepID=A0A410W9R6_9CORY|nr:hypothetical protein [Corynebacterium pelargi]QAU52703.1 hypothetical protein CPELA_07205 [Corynebacterium pelargi]GGG78253.1 hypothetical protein GCM10007338_15330 [Corynebacterium pelargi]